MLPSRAPLEDFRAPTKLKLSALWASLMFCYVYGDYLGLYLPGKLMEMNAGRMGPLGELTPGVHVAVALMMAVPSLMVALSLLLPSVAARWLNIVLGLAYSAIMVLTTIGGAPAFYLTLAAIEIAITLAITWCAVRWPREGARVAGG